MALVEKKRQRKIKFFRTNSGENFNITISKETAIVFSGCFFTEQVCGDCIIFKSGCGVDGK